MNIYLKGNTKLKKISRMNYRLNRRIISNVLLLITAIIWGFAFTAQSIGMKYVGPWTFVFTRFIIASIILIPITIHSEKIYRNSDPRFSDKTIRFKYLYIKQSILYSAIVGVLLGIASITQQIGLLYTSSGKAGFITALYVVIVPIMNSFHKKLDIKTWVAVFLSLAGLYRISMNASFSIGIGDLFVVFCAFAFSFQIVTIDRFSEKMNPVLLANLQFFFASIVGFIGMIIFERSWLEQVLDGLIPILYAGIFSSAVGYTLQIVAQRNTDPTIASLLMSLESVFAAIGGFLVLHERMTLREFTGCILVFVAVILSQVDFKIGKSDCT